MASKKKNVADFSSDRPPKTIGDLFYGMQLDEEQLTIDEAQNFTVPQLKNVLMFAT